MPIDSESARYMATTCSVRTSTDAPVSTRSSVHDFFGHLFDTSSYPARWHCGEWTAFEGWLHIISDVAIFGAYFAIPVALIYFVRRRRDVPFHGVFFLFAAFIMSCGTGHLLEAVIFYYPIYRVAGLLKLFTAIVSCVTVIVLLRLIPKTLDLPALVTKNESLRKADIAKSAFLANMSHEIRTPMSAILGYTEWLQDEATGDIPAERREAIDAIQRNGEHLLELVNDILDLSKIEAGKLEIELTRTCPRTTLQEVMRLLQVRAEDRNLQLILQVDPVIPNYIRTDRTRFRQILINLVGNAIKFTKEGSVTVDARMDLVTFEKPVLKVEVIDTGIGIHQAAIPRLFSPFTQADSSTTRRFGGTGLGLAISKRLAVALGGDISVSSELDQGSTFTVWIDAPAVEDASVPKLAVAGMGELSGATNSSSLFSALSGYRILLAEDGDDNQRLITLILKKAGADVEAVFDGQAAVERAEEAAKSNSPFDAILMDMQMPRLDGYQATQRLRCAGATVPIIALTAHAMDGDREKCLAAGCDEYVTKPIDREKLLATLRRFVAPSPAFVGSDSWE